MTVAWTITNPGGSGVSALADLGLTNPTVNFRVMGVSTATLTGHRDFDSEEDWWEYDELVTIYRDGQPYFTGRVQDIADSATASSEVRTLHIADAWMDLEEIIYRETWEAGAEAVFYPRAILGLNAAGTRISTGQQINDAVAYAITQGAGMQIGTIAAGQILWPSEIRNQSCEAVILGELRFHPDWVAWLDHTTPVPTFHARPKSDLDTATVDVAEEGVEELSFGEVKRTVPRGVSIIYESADTIDGEVYRATFEDTAGNPSGRRIIRAMVDLEGMNVSYQKSRIETRTMPTNAASMTAWMKLKYPELAVIPDAAFVFSNVSLSLAPLGAQPPPVNPIAQRLAVAAAAELPRELVKGSIEDWMRKKAGRVTVKYDLDFARPGATPPTAEQKKLIDQFKGIGKSVSVTATNAITKLYKGVSSFTAGEGMPEGIAAAVFAAATEQQWEGAVAVTAEDVPGGRWVGKKLTLHNGEAGMLSGAVIHSATADIEGGRLTISYGPLPYLAAGDFLDLQRILNRRVPTWMSPAERTSNELGSELTAGSKGDIVSGYDMPDTITPPGAEPVTPHYWPSLVTIPGEGEAADTYAVTVTHGWVREIKTGYGDALGYHEALNHYDEVAPPTDPITYTENLTAHDIEAGQAVYVTCQIDADGRVVSGESEEETPPVEIEVADDEEESIQYIPKVDTGTPDGAAGTLRFKLAMLEAGEGEDPPRLKYFLAGDHIHWSPPLPAFRTAWDAGDGVGVIFREWLNAANCYMVRAITRRDNVEATEDVAAWAAQIDVVQEFSRIIIKGNDVVRDITFQIGDSSILPLAKIRDGLVARDDDAGASINLPIPVVQERADRPAQVRVSLVGFGGTVYEARGNDFDTTLSYQVGTGTPVEFARFEDGLLIAKEDLLIPMPGDEGYPGTGATGSLTYTMYGETAVELIEWENGLVTSEGEKDIPLPAPGVNIGDMLFWNGEAWITFENPGDPDADHEWVLHTYTGFPEWIQYKKITVFICESGTPAEYTILGTPTPPP